MIICTRFRRLAAAALTLGGVLAVWALQGAPPEAQAQGPGRGPVYLPGRYIVVFEAGVANPRQVAAQMAQQHGLGLGHLYSATIRGFSAAIPEARLGAVASDPRVHSVERDQVVYAIAKPNKPGKGGGDGDSQPAQQTPTGIRRIGADSSSAAAGDGAGSVDVDIAIIDTGIDGSHPDLNVVGGVNYTTGNPSNWSDGHGHGTHVAGTAAGKDDEIGVVGAAPGARLWAVKVLNNGGTGSLSGVIAGVDWVAERAGTIEVANMSLGGGKSDALNSAVNAAVQAGVVFVVAAGNSSDDAKDYSPASAEKALTVSAISDADGECGSDTLASFSNYGAVIDLAAPGVNILSTYKGGGYATFSGTSMAAPHVAGTAALYRATHPSASPQDVEDALESAGFTRSGACGFSGDRDGYAEPVVNAGMF